MKKIAFITLCFTGIIVLTSCKSKQPPPVVNPIDTTITDWKHFIRKDSAQAMIYRYVALRKSLIVGAKFQENFLAQSEVMQTAQSMLRYMMLQPTCTGIRVYYGVNKDGRIVPIICGIDAKGNDMYWKKTRERVAKKSTADSSTVAAAQDMEEEEEGLCDMATKEPPPVNGATVRLITN